jgi:CubicO group peptidase (beta-lactamase class C family)
MTKPIVAAGALVLVEECRLRLEDPVDELLPELADRRVLVDQRGPIDGETVPADRPITVEDVLTFRLGLGMDFTAPWPQPLLEAMSELGLAAGPPEPQLPPEPDEWMRRLSTLPLLHQPGERWLYNTGSDVLGVLIGRASGQPLDVYLRERVFDPLGMSDTGFATPTSTASAPATRGTPKRASGACSTRPRASGQSLPHSRRAGPGSCPPSTTTTRSPACCCPAVGCRTARASCPGPPSRR